MTRSGRRSSCSRASRFASSSRATCVQSKSGSTRRRHGWSRGQSSKHRLARREPSRGQSSKLRMARRTNLDAWLISARRATRAPRPRPRSRLAQRGPTRPTARPAATSRRPRAPAGVSTAPRPRRPGRRGCPTPPGGARGRSRRPPRRAAAASWRWPRRFLGTRSGLAVRHVRSLGTFGAGTVSLRRPRARASRRERSPYLGQPRSPPSPSPRCCETRGVYSDATVRN